MDEAGDAFGKLIRLLAEERRALLDGELASLEGFSVRKENLFRRLRDRGLSRSRLDRLSTELGHNARLALAAAAGIRSVVEMSRELRRGGPALSAYSENGEKRVIGNDPSGIQRRA